jgi:hypothetical protein
MNSSYPTIFNGGKEVIVYNNGTSKYSYEHKNSTNLFNCFAVFKLIKIHGTK